MCNQPDGEHPEQASEPASEDDFLDEVVTSYIQEQMIAGSAAGKSPAEIEQSFNQSSWILSVRMLRDWHGGSMPEGAELLRGLAELTGADEAEARDICRVFVAAGWLDAAYSLTEAGRLSGQV
ncbi:MAG: hypothetical protein CVV27_09375 [Candidatus Melainabacteria bacterium HGW-Melainabacteria-1]|nr:MAG: hypothetical protein CVV27_09375 [Candidatus Melainabacteria bacterium HGW-Melainabacteria-1]